MHDLIAGVDEVGRGPLAGDVVAAAVILNPQVPISGLTDSKKLSALKRESLAPLIRSSSLAWCVASASVEEIDRLNILQATMLAMQRAVAGLDLKPNRVLVDGNRCPDFQIPAEAIIKGDLLEPCISAASILAKVARDQTMKEMELVYPGYGFAAHKGYPTRAHLSALERLGPLQIHRKSFAPVRRRIKALS